MIPKYIQLKKQLCEDIISQKYTLFSNLPTEMELTSIYNVSRTTVRQALSMMEAEGIIEKKWGSGNTIVSSPNDLNKNTVVLIVPSLDTNLWSVNLDDIRVALSKEGLTVSIIETNYSQQKERDLLNKLSTDLYAGYIIQRASMALPSINTDIFHKLIKWKQPLLFVGDTPDTVYNVPSFGIDDYDCAYQCTRHFINKGLTSIGACFYINSDISYKHYQGYMEALRDANIKINEDSILWTTRDLVGLSTFINDIKETTEALVCDNTIIGSEVLSICNYNNIAIRDELSVATCDYPMLSINAHKLTGLKPVKSFGKELANHFLKIKKDGSSESATIRCDLEIGTTS